MCLQLPSNKTSILLFFGDALRRFGMRFWTCWADVGGSDTSGGVVGGMWELVWKACTRKQHIKANENTDCNIRQPIETY